MRIGAGRPGFIPGKGRIRSRPPAQANEVFVRFEPAFKTMFKKFLCSLNEEHLKRLRPSADSAHRVFVRLESIGSDCNSLFWQRNSLEPGLSSPWR